MAYGLRLGVRVSEGSVTERVIDRLPPVRRAATSPAVDRLYSLIVGSDENASGVRRLHLAYADAGRLARSRRLDDALDAFEADLQLYVAEFARRRVFVHAGVVGWRGRAIVIPGRSGSGKSTLVAALLRAGATYYSDEYAVLDESGRVHPYPSPLALRVGEQTQKARHPTAEMAGGVGVAPLPVGLVAVSRYRSDGAWKPRSITAGRGMLALLANTVAARRRPQASLAALERVVRGARVLDGVRGEADLAARALLGEVA